MISVNVELQRREGEERGGVLSTLCQIAQGARRVVLYLVIGNEYEEQMTTCSKVWFVQQLCRLSSECLFPGRSFEYRYLTSVEVTFVVHQLVCGGPSQVYIMQIMRFLMPYRKHHILHKKSSVVEPACIRTRSTTKAVINTVVIRDYPEGMLEVQTPR